MSALKGPITGMTANELREAAKGVNWQAEYEEACRKLQFGLHNVPPFVPESLVRPMLKWAEDLADAPHPTRARVCEQVPVEWRGFDWRHDGQTVYFEPSTREAFNARDWLDTQPFEDPAKERKLDEDADAWFWWVMAACALVIGFGAGLVVGWVKGWFS